MPSRDYAPRFSSTFENAPSSFSTASQESWLTFGLRSMVEVQPMLHRTYNPLRFVIALDRWYVAFYNYLLRVTLSPFALLYSK